MFGNKKTKRIQQKLIGVLVRTINGIPEIIAEQSMSFDDSIIHFKGYEGSFPFDKISVLYRRGNINYMFFSYDTKGSIISWSKTEYGIDIKTLDVLLRHNIVVGFLALIKNVFDKKDLQGKLAGYIVVGIMGGALGYIASETMRNSAQLILMGII